MATIFASTTPELTVPLQGTLRRCPHGIYIPPHDTTAPYCQSCTPGGPADQRDVVIPSDSGTSLNKFDRHRANNNDGRSCPECGSVAYMRVKISDAHRECADCGQQYRVRFTQRELAEQALERLGV